MKDLGNTHEYEGRKVRQRRHKCVYTRKMSAGRVLGVAEQRGRGVKEGEAEGRGGLLPEV